MKKLFVLFAFLCLMMLNGCVSINSDVHIHSNMSGTWVANVNSEVGPLAYDDINKTMTKANVSKYEIYILDAQNKEVKAKTGDKAVHWIIKGSFQNPDELGSLLGLFSQNVSENPPLQEHDGKIYVNLGPSMGKTTVEVDGDVVKDSLKYGKLNGHTVSFEKDEPMVFQFKKAGLPWSYIIGIVIVLIIVAVGTMYYVKQRKG